jgi:hypothetical protein
VHEGASWANWAKGYEVLFQSNTIASFDLVYTHKGFTSERVGDVGVPRPIAVLPHLA